MNPYICLLVTVLYEANQTLLQCALRIRDWPSEDCREHFMEPENRKLIHVLLPAHVRSCGPIVQIEEIFEIEVKP